MVLNYKSTTIQLLLIVQTAKFIEGILRDPIYVVYMENCQAYLILYVVCIYQNSKIHESLFNHDFFWRSALHED